MGGSMGQFVGEALRLVAKSQLNLNVLLYQFHPRRCKDARGNCSLMQLPKTVAAVNMLDQHKIPYISVLTHPTTGGVVLRLLCWEILLLLKKEV